MEIPRNYSVAARWFQLPVKDAPNARLKCSIFFEDRHGRGFDVPPEVLSNTPARFGVLGTTESKKMLKSFTGGMKSGEWGGAESADRRED